MSGIEDQNKSRKFATLANETDKATLNAATNWVNDLLKGKFSEPDAIRFEADVIKQMGPRYTRIVLLGRSIREMKKEADHSLILPSYLETNNEAMNQTDIAREVAFDSFNHYLLGSSGKSYKDQREMIKKSPWDISATRFMGTARDYIELALLAPRNETHLLGDWKARTTTLTTKYGHDQLIVVGPNLNGVLNVTSHYNTYNGKDIKAMPLYEPIQASAVRVFIGKSG